MKEAFRIICDLIYKQEITYDEAYILMKELFGGADEQEQVATNPWPWPYNPNSPYLPVEPTYPTKPIEVWYESDGTPKYGWKYRYENNDSKTNFDNEWWKKWISDNNV